MNNEYEDDAMMAQDRVRTDLLSAAYVAGMEDALRRVEELTDDSDYNVALIAREALSARPDAPDLRVVPAVVLVEIAIPIEAMLISGQNSMSDEMFMAFQKSADCIRAIIGGMK